ncbi:DUF4097 family beta strand repeat-containing protein [Flavilitoribacter nigricans]|uniref:DUF4097 domain-containing protein n=1 Tax=Flavilitoribacter nigricans (strain ATCC 23147 / DSM 23189 / NBRC 102662 / NCIMB 1420 / SS-2) TaxID=1122177 RepID=A0A2D0NE16_FLAN2|nr:DUF4097 family beta strand repeat-containing protein [Flavilitoribacter nigricans]PHN06620.1 hypothetical protein CRP01_09985 [Flavilitoribacter nigricans DSM 23189 = NBRC 102662]
MKRLILSVVLLLSCSAICLAQMTKQEEATFPVPSGKKIEANLKFAKKIDIKSWNRQEIGLKKTITYSKEELLSIDQQSAKEQDGVLVIETDYDMKKDGERKYQCWSCDNENWNGNECVCFQISYELMLPAGMSLELETISGDINLLGSYNGGELNLETISGGIEIKNYKGQIRAKSISGFVDFTSPGNQGFDAAFKSVTGEIYTDFDLKLDEGSTAWSKRLNRSLNGGGKKVALETVSGDIFLRKSN